MNTTRETIKLFWEHAKRYPQFLLPLLFVVPITVAVTEFARPYIISIVLEKISNNNYDSANLWASFSTEIITFAVVAFAGIVIGWRINTWLIWSLELNVARDIAQRVFDHLMLMSADFHANRFAGSLVSQANKLTGAYIRFSDATILQLYTLLIAIVATVIILAPRVPLYAIILIVLSICYVAGVILLSKKVRESNKREAEAQSKLTGYLADSISNVMAVKSFAARQYESNRYWQAASYVRDMGSRSLKATTQRETYASLVASCITISAVLIAIIGVGFFALDIATIFLMVIYTSTIATRLWSFQNVMRQYNRAFGDASDMVQILRIEPGVQDLQNPEPVRISQGALNIKDMSFTHADTTDALFSHLNLQINSGEKIGLVGHSGSGKTTLTKLLLRFADINGGEILIDGQNIATITQDDLRRYIAYVPQEPLLFHRTIRENIAYGRPDASEEAVKEAAQKAHVAEFVEKLPHGYDTLVGERGVKLSGGQRQRIAIARAILKDAPILVLDEATSALDSESERLIQDALWELMKGRTAIVIAHRLSTVQKMDRILVMKHGAIIEQGSHKTLLAQKGEYAKLWAHQSGGFIEE